MSMHKCHICDYATIERRMLLSHFRDKHGSPLKFKVETEGRVRRCIFEGKVLTVDGKAFKKYRVVEQDPRVSPVKQCISVPVYHKSNLDKKRTHVKFGRFQCGKCDFTSSSKTSLEATAHKFACGKMPKSTLKPEVQNQDKYEVGKGTQSEKREIVKTFRIQDIELSPEEVMSNVCVDIKKEF